MKTLDISLIKNDVALATSWTELEVEGSLWVMILLGDVEHMEVDDTAIPTPKVDATIHFFCPPVKH